jgi:hypothetical protein
MEKVDPKCGLLLKVSVNALAILVTLLGTNSLSSPPSANCMKNA